MRSRIIAWICTVILLTGLSACANIEEHPGIDIDTPKSAEELENIRDQIGEPGPVTRSSGMNEAELLADLNNCEEFFAEFSSNAGFIAADIQINQRNTEKKQSDEIYADITSVNEFSSFTAEFYLHYTYYNTGGWRLDAVRQNRDGVYYITYWPDEADLYQVWNDTYSEKYDNGVIETCEIESSGTDYVMFLVEFSNSSELATRYQKTEVRFGFTDGLWTTASMLYPGEFAAGDPHWVLHEDAVQGLYLGVSSSDDSIHVTIENFYTSDIPDTSLNPTALRVDVYEYYVNRNLFETNLSESVGRVVAFDFDTVEGGYAAGSKMRLRDGAWYNDGVKMERLEEFPDAPLTEEDIRSLIQRVVEERGFEYWEDFEAAQRAKEQERIDTMQAEWDELSQDAKVAAYREACADFYRQIDIEFPAGLDPCMYAACLSHVKLYPNQYSYMPDSESYTIPVGIMQILNFAPNPLDYFDWTVSDQISAAYDVLYYTSTENLPFLQQ